MSDTITAAAIEAAHSALLTACPNLDEANGACTADEEECFAVHPVHFAWQQAGQYGVVGDTRAIAKTVLDAAAPVLLADHDERIADMRAAYDQKVAELARETERVGILATRLMAHGHEPVGFHAKPGHRNSCADCMALAKALGDPAAIARGSQPADSGGQS